MTDYQLEIYKDKTGGFRWRRTAPGGEILSASAAAFPTRKACEANEKAAVVIGWRASENISRVEGLKLSATMKQTFAKSTLSHEERRQQIKARYAKNGG